MNGIINFYKPPGMTSFQAVHFIKRMTGQKAGHAGTLDPEAAGVLPILLGRATKICDYLMNQEKQYLAEIAFGSATDTQDAQGKVEKESSELPNLQMVQQVLDAFIGDIEQVPPQYSALKVGGETAYKLARKGKTVALASRPVRIESIQLLKQTSEDSFLLRVVCGKGAYIRTLCHDIGIVLGCPAHLRFLLRKRNGVFDLNDAVTPETIIDWQKQSSQNPAWLIGMEEALRHLPRIDLPEHLAIKAIHGVALPEDSLEQTTNAAEQTEVCFFYRDQIIGIFQKSEGFFRVKVMITLVDNFPV